MTTAREHVRDTIDAPPVPAPLDGGGTDIVPWSEWQLVQNRYTALRGVVFEDLGDAIRLGGRVPTHYLKQVALAAACGLAGSRPIHNEIEVVGAPVRRPAPAPDRHATDPTPTGLRPARWRSAPPQPNFM